jgi:hypothetical protein
MNNFIVNNENLKPICDFRFLNETQKRLMGFSPYRIFVKNIIEKKV